MISHDISWHLRIKNPTDIPLAGGLPVGFFAFMDL